MTHKLKYLSLGSITAFMLVIAFGMFYVAKANPVFFLRAATNAGFATTTTAFMSAGAATTTLAVDLGAGGAQGADSAVLLRQFTGSTTAATLSTVIEYSAGNPGLDCVANQNACNWYLGFATTSLALGVRTGGVGGGVGSTTQELLNVPTPTRYVRAVFSIPAAGVSGAIYAEFAAKRQSN